MMACIDLGLLVTGDGAFSLILPLYRCLLALEKDFKRQGIRRNEFSHVYTGHHNHKFLVLLQAYDFTCLVRTQRADLQQLASSGAQAQSSFCSACLRAARAVAWRISSHAATAQG
jgi:hypothetical protein